MRRFGTRLRERRELPSTSIRRAAAERDADSTSSLAHFQLPAPARRPLKLSRETVLAIRSDVRAGILSADWYYTKNILFNLTLEHQERTSNVDAFKVESNKITIGAKVRF